MKIRGLLTSEEIQEISSQLPNTDPLARIVPHLDAEIVAMRSPRNRRLSIAGTCLSEAISVLLQARFALYEAHAHKMWYERHVTDVEHPEFYALYTSRFFGDDAALRVYAVGEYLAEAIVILLNIDKRNLERGQKGSLQNRVGKYLVTNFPNHEFTNHVSELVASDVWKKTRNYRDRWVHVQPPLIVGFGRQFLRKERWKNLTEAEIAKWKSIFPDFNGNIGMSRTALGDEPEITIDEWLGNLRGALLAISVLTEKIVSYYLEALESKSKP